MQDNVTQADDVPADQCDTNWLSNSPSHLAEYFNRAQRWRNQNGGVEISPGKAKAAAKALASTTAQSEAVQKLVEAGSGLESLLTLIAEGLWEDCPFPDVMKKRIEAFLAALAAHRESQP